MTFKRIKEIFMMTFATAIIAVAVYFFLFPSHASISSVSSVAMILSNFIPMKISVISMIINIILLVLGFLLCGNEFGYKTIYTSILLPIFLWVLEEAFPGFKSLTGSDILDVAAYIFLVSFGLSLLFNMNASSGGIDIISKILHKYLHIELGTAMSMAGVVVALSAAFVYESRTVVLSVVGTYLNGLVLDHFIFGQKMKKRVCIVSEDVERVRQFIIHELQSGATLYQAVGAYQMNERPEIIAVVDKAEYQKLMTWIDKNDPDAFITVYNVSDMRYRPKNLERLR